MVARSQIGGSSRIGKKDQENQDAWYGSPTNQYDKRGALVVVCDGVSGTENGAWAANITCNRLRELYLSDEPLSRDVWVQCILEIDWEIRGKGLGKAACTLVMGWFYQGQALLLGVGDSKILWLQEQQLHCFGEKGESHLLQQFMGMGENLTNHLREQCLALQGEEVFFLMTDGPAETLQPEQILGVWQRSAENPSQCATHLTQLAEDTGSKDDNTVVVLYYQTDDKQEDT